MDKEGEALNDMLIEQIALLNKKKDEMITQALEIKGISLDLELEKTRRFKSMMCVDDKDSGLESYYYNDGSEDGLLIISFQNSVSIQTIEEGDGLMCRLWKEQENNKFINEQEIKVKL